MTELPRRAAARTARLAALPLGYAGRTAVGFGRRLGGAPAEQVLTDVQQRTAEQIFRTLGELKGGAMKFGQALSVLEAGLPEELVAPYRASTPTHRGGWRGALERTTLFGPLEERTFTYEHVQDADGLGDRVASISFIASLPPHERERVVAAARELAEDGPVTVPYRTEVFVCERDAVPA